METDKERNDPPIVIVVPLIISIIYSLILAFLPELLFLGDLDLWMPGILSSLIIFGYTKSAPKSIVSGILGMVFFAIILIVIIILRISSGAPGFGLH